MNNQIQINSEIKNKLCSSMAKINGKDIRHVFIPYLSEEEQNTIKNFELENIVSAKKGYSITVKWEKLPNLKLEEVIDDESSANFLYNIILKLGNDLANCLRITTSNISIKLLVNEDSYDNTRKWHVDTTQDSIRLSLVFAGKPTLFPACDSKNLYTDTGRKFHPMAGTEPAYSTVKSWLINATEEANFGELAIFSNGLNNGVAHRSPNADEGRLVVFLDYNFPNPNHFDNVIGDIEVEPY